MNNLHYDVIIVLGSGLNPDSSVPDHDKTRLSEACRFYNDKIASAIIVCGGQSYKATKTSNLSEAQAYANFLYKLGVPYEDVYLESESKETVGNILFAKMRIVIKRDWRKLLIIPTVKHSTERVEYLTKKILGHKYIWSILRVGENKEKANIERESKATKLSKDINDKYTDGDHQAIYNGLMETHPAYGGTKWTLDELREEMKQ